MDFITPEQYQRLAENGKLGLKADYLPVVMLENSAEQEIWLLTSIGQFYPMAYGLRVKEGHAPCMKPLDIYGLFQNNAEQLFVPEPAFVPQFPVSFYQAHAEQRNGTLDRNLLTTPIPY